MQGKLDRAEVSLYAAETERDDAQARMDEAQGRIDSASSRISELQDKLGNRARSMYRSGSSTFSIFFWEPPRFRPSPRTGTS